MKQKPTVSPILQHYKCQTLLVNMETKNKCSASIRGGGAIRLPWEVEFTPTSHPNVMQTTIPLRIFQKRCQLYLLLNLELIALPHSLGSALPREQDLGPLL